MKTINKIIIAAMIMGAVGSAYASLLVSVDGYIQIAPGTPVNTNCIYIGQCANEGSFICKGRLTAGGTPYQLYKLNPAGTACTVNVFHTSSQPIN